MPSELNLMKKMDFGSIFEWSFRLLKKHFIFLIKSMSYFFIPGVIVLIISIYFIFPAITDFFNTIFSGVQNESFYDQFPIDMVSGIFKLYGLIFLVFIFYSLFILGAFACSVKAIAVKIEQKKDTELDIVKFVLKKYLPLLLTILIAGAMCIAGSCFCFIPGVILYIYMIFIPQVVILENKYFFKAIGRSFYLVNKNFWIIILLLIVLYFLYTIISGIIVVPVYMIPYIKFIMKIIKMGGELDPSMNFMKDFMKEFMIYYLVMLGIQVIVSIFYIITLNNALTLKFYNIRNLREGTQLLDELNKEMKNK